MKVGLIGAGNMARAMARGWGEPVLCSDSGSGRAAELVAELGGVATTNVEVARQADLVVLCHKPAQLMAVADEIAPARPRGRLGARGHQSAARWTNAYPGVPVFLLMPNTAVEVRRGIVCYTPAPEVDPELERAVVSPV